MAKRTWSELSPGTRGALTAGIVVQVVLLGVAHADLSRRPAEQVRGPKGMWRLLTLINFIGPIAYFACGRRTP